MQLHRNILYVCLDMIHSQQSLMHVHRQTDRFNVSAAFDVTDKNSLEELKQGWVPFYEEWASEQNYVPVIMLMGCKADLVSGRRLAILSLQLLTRHPGSEAALRKQHFCCWQRTGSTFLWGYLLGQHVKACAIICLLGAAATVKHIKTLVLISH